ncbi:MAG: IclR family transcriptional regulator [Solirubrobacteraceae bacterium]
MLGTVARAGAVLDLFTTEEPEWGVTATAQRLGIGKSLAHDVLASLAGIGLLQRVGHGRYRHGWRTVTLASVLLRTSELKAHARPVVRDLAERQGLTVSLAAWDCGRIIYIDRRYSARHTNACGPVAGTAAPLDGSAAAKVLLASRPRDEVKTLWGDGLVHTRHASVDELETDLEVVRRHGWAHNDAEENLGGQRGRGTGPRRRG